jgi:hypothetical protein
MLRPRILISYSLVLGLSALAATGCKKGEKADTKQEAKPAEVTEVTPTEVAEQPPLAGDLPLIDKTLVALADATLVKARKPAEAGGLPLLEGEIGIACGTDDHVTMALAAIGFDPTPLKKEMGFRFINVCVGWRPYVKPYNEMFWMISAGAPLPETGVMPHRRCVRVYATEGGFEKAEITDGLCLELHVKSRERAMAEGDAPEEGDKAGPPPDMEDKAPVAPESDDAE